MRGRSPAISDFFEDNFAKILGNILLDRYDIFVDYPITYQINNQRRTTCYPDIMVVRNDNKSDRLLSGIIELKIDLGYLSDNWAKTKLNQINTLKERVEQVTINLGIGTNQKILQLLGVKENFPWAVVLLTSLNDHGRLKNIKNELSNGDVQCFVISNNIHPRGYEIDKSNKNDNLNKIYRDKENIKNWKGLADFFNNNFKED